MEILFSLLKYACLILLIYLLNLFIIQPYVLLLHYKAQGFKHSYFFPVFGVIRLYKSASRHSKDYLSKLRNLGRDDPACKGFVYNIREEVVIGFTSPEYRNEFFNKQSECYEKRSAQFRYFQHLWGRENLLVSEGGKWQIRRRILTKALNTSNLKPTIDIVVNNTDAVIEDFLRQADLKKFNPLREVQRIVGLSFVESFFGKEIHRLSFEGQPVACVISQIFVDLGKLLYRKSNFLLGSKISSKFMITKEKNTIIARINRFRSALRAFIKEQRLRTSSQSTQASPLLFEQLIIAAAEEKFSEKGLDELEFSLNEFLTLFIMGYDKIGHLISHVLYLLSQNQDSMKLLYKEVSENLPVKGQAWQTDVVLNGMPYLTAVIKEALRLYTPVPDVFMRIAQKDHYIKDIFVKKGTRVEMLMTVPCSSPKYFDKPEDFIPGRWLTEEGRKFETSHPNVYIPFSSGARDCIGQSFSMIQAKIILARFLQKLDVKLNTESKSSLEWVMRYVYETKTPLLYTCVVRK